MSQCERARGRVIQWRCGAGSIHARGLQIALCADPIPEFGEILLYRLDTYAHESGFVAQEIGAAAGDGLDIALDSFGQIGLGFAQHEVA